MYHSCGLAHYCIDQMEVHNKYKGRERENRREKEHQAMCNV
jgi:hypothetical protein